MAKEIYLEEKDTLTIWRPDDMWPWQNDWMILWRIEGNFAVSLLDCVVYLVCLKMLFMLCMSLCLDMWKKLKSTANKNITWSQDKVFKQVKMY